MDVAPPTGWTLISRAAEFEFMIQPPPGGPLRNFIPPLAAPPPFAPAPPGPPPISGDFTIYSVENPVSHRAYTIDHLLGRFPAPPGNHIVDAPNNKEELSCVTSVVRRERGGYRYTYTLSSLRGRVNQAIIHLPREVRIESIKLSDESWSTYRVGFDKPRNRDCADGRPSHREKGMLYFGSFDVRIGPSDGSRSVSFFSRAKPAYISSAGEQLSGTGNRSCALGRRRSK